MQMRNTSKYKKSDFYHIRSRSHQESPKRVEFKERDMNEMDYSIEKSIEEIKEDPNETFMSLTPNRTPIDDSSLFESPQLSNVKQGKYR